jgi:Cys-rich repeat protein
MRAYRLATANVVWWLAVVAASGCGAPSTTETPGTVVCEPPCPKGLTCTAGGCALPDGGGIADLSASLLDMTGAGCTPACGGATPFCNESKVCVPCLLDTHCPAGNVCRVLGNASACVPGCKDDSRCAGVVGDGGAGAMKCCGGQCVDTAGDAQNCGACGAACAIGHATAKCSGGQCALIKCSAGWGDCNMNPADGCEANLHVDVKNCTACGMACAFAHATAACADGCYLAACNFGFDDCDGKGDNGCETSTLSDVKNCGGCGMACGALANAVVGCNNAVCAITSCKQGFLDCDNNPKNGCETAAANDRNNCGMCGVACGQGQVCINGGCTCANCAITNATTKCVNNMCVFDKCVAGFGDCNNNLNDGCEIQFSNDKNNCGACGNVCPNNLANCVQGVCSAMRQFAGQFKVSDGPPWAPNPPCYTCQEACALLFGGQSGDYSCSTQKGMIDHMAYEDGWGDTVHCNPGGQVAEDYKKSVNYNCGGQSCSYSAYVMDHGCASINYCFR